jgi:hypothetical protein
MALLYKLTVKVSHLAFRFLKRLTSFLDALHSGFWLGVLGKKALDYSDEVHYAANTTYVEDEYNEKGLLDWESYIVEKHFAEVKTIMLIAAGGGREVLGLTRMGFSVDGFECNPVLVEYSNRLLLKNNVDSRIAHLPRNTVPAEIRKYDAVIIGWGAYSHIKGGTARIGFLKNLYPFMHPASRLMISFIWVKERNRRDRMIQRVSGFLGLFCRGERSEQGDKLVPNYMHYFREDEIRTELTRAGFRVIEYDEVKHGFIIAEIL